MAKGIEFKLPPAGTFKPNHASDDPLPYYYKPGTAFLYKKRIQAGLDLLSGSYGNVLEFGFGSGLLLPSLAQVAERLYGIDICSEPEVVQESLARINISAELKRGNIVTAGYPSDFFDLVAAFSVFEHIAEPTAILEEMYRILKPEGTLLVGMPRVDGSMDLLFRAIGYDNIDCHHVKNHTDFIKDADRFFKLEKKKRMPFFMPDSLGLYFNMLFKKEPGHGLISNSN